MSQSRGRTSKTSRPSKLNSKSNSVHLLRTKQGTGSQTGLILQTLLQTKR